MASESDMGLASGAKSRRLGHHSFMRKKRRHDKGVMLATAA